MSEKVVKFELDPDRLPPLTQRQKAELEVLKVLPDSDIDYSDIPPLTDDFWKQAVCNPFRRLPISPKDPCYQDAR